MSTKTYQELFDTLEVDRSGQATPQDLRDVLDALATDRVVTNNTGSWPQVTTGLPSQVAGLTLTAANSERVDINADGTITFKEAGLYQTVVFMVVDASNIGGNTRLLYLQMFKDGNPNSVEAAVQRTQRSSNVVLRIGTENFVEEGETFDIIPMMASSEVGTTVAITQVYVSVRSVPVLKT